MTTRKRQSGFTLIELMIVVVILMLVTGVVFSQVDLVQKRYRYEVDKSDATQEARETMQQIMRDLRQSGFPNELIFETTPATSSSTLAVGLVLVAEDDLWLEGDLDGDGVVDSVRYSLYPDDDGECPCTIDRAQIEKVNGTEPWTQDTSVNAYRAISNVLNSGTIAYTIGGTTSIPGGDVVDNDDMYSDLKTAPVFQAYDALGNEITLPLSLETDGADAMAAIRAIRVNINTFGWSTDMQTGRRPVVTLSQTTRLINLE